MDVEEIEDKIEWAMACYPRDDFLLDILLLLNEYQLDSKYNVEVNHRLSERIKQKQKTYAEVGASGKAALTIVLDNIRGLEK
jgi:hypothetical protein